MLASWIASRIGRMYADNYKKYKADLKMKLDIENAKAKVEKEKHGKK